MNSKGSEKDKSYEINKYETSFYSNKNNLLLISNDKSSRFSSLSHAELIVCLAGL